MRKDQIENTKRRLNKTKLNIMRTVKTSMWETFEGHERSFEYMERHIG